MALSLLAYIRPMCIPIRQITSRLQHLWALVIVLAIVALPFAGPAHTQFPRPAAAEVAQTHPSAMTAQGHMAQMDGESCLTFCMGWCGPSAEYELAARAVLLPHPAVPTDPLRRASATHTPIPRPPNPASFA